MHDFLARQSALGAEPWTRLWHVGLGAAWRANTGYISQNASRWHQALLG